MTPKSSTASLGELLRAAPLPAWLREMKDRYHQTGTFRPEDLYRLLGDPNKRVEVKADTSVASLLAGLQRPE